MQRESPIARMVREAIETVATPEVRVQILHRALHMAREHEIPASGEPLRHFADKHLRTAMAFYLGNEASAPSIRFSATSGATSGYTLNVAIPAATQTGFPESVPA